MVSTADAAIRFGKDGFKGKDSSQIGMVDSQYDGILLGTNALAVQTP
jgi:hypothetical protein